MNFPTMSRDLVTPEAILALLLLPLSCGERDQTIGGTNALLDGASSTLASDAAASIPVSGMPRLVASGQSSPLAIVTDDANVYWRNSGEGGQAGKIEARYVGGSIMACSLGGCGGSPQALIGGLVSEPAGGRALATDGTNVYSTAYQQDGSENSGSEALFACSVTGCQNGSRTLFENVFWLSIAFASGTLYWLAGQSSTCGLYETVANNFGSSVVPTCLWKPGNENLQGDITVANGFVYWAELEGTIEQCSLSGCGAQATVFVRGIQGPRALASGGQFIYFTNSDPLKMDSIYQCDVTGCPNGPTVLATGREGIVAIAADENYMYWTEVGKVMRCAVGGCAGQPETFALGFTRPAAIALSLQNVYWTELGNSQGDGRVWAAAK